MAGEGNYLGVLVDPDHAARRAHEVRDLAGHVAAAAAYVDAPVADDDPSTSQ